MFFEISNLNGRPRMAVPLHLGTGHPELGSFDFIRITPLLDLPVDLFEEERSNFWLATAVAATKKTKTNFQEFHRNKKMRQQQKIEGNN